MKRTLLFSLIILCSISGWSQQRDIPLKEYFADAEYFLLQEEYVDALHDYMQVYKRGYENNANINYHIGVCYLHIPGEKDRAIEYLEKAAINASDKYRESTLNETYSPNDVYLFLGNAYRINYELDTAIVRYEKYLSLISSKTPEEQDYVKKQIEACNIAKEYVVNPINAHFDNMGAIINTNTSNYNAVISGDGSTLVYMTKLTFYEAIFMSKRRGNNWSRPLNVTPHIMSDGDQIVTGISHDGKTLLLAKSDLFNSDIYVSEFIDGQWSKSKPISKNINTKYWESHASFSSDGNTIYFTSNKKGGVGAMDIYKSQRNEKGEWGVAENLGEGINTPLNEDTPFVSADGKKLFYSSQGHKNIGGYDYFYSEYVDTAWTYPQNLQYPLSTTDEDLFYYPIGNGETALVHAMLEDGYGLYDIYEVSYPSAEELEEAISEQIEADVNEETDDLADEPEVSEPVVEVILRPLLFAFDQSQISDEAAASLKEIIAVLNSDQKLGLRIIGYTDALGPANYNLLLSKKRASQVASYFIDNGIQKERIEIIGKGETNFIAPNTKPDGSDNPEGRAYNRRVEFEMVSVDGEFYIIKKEEIVPEHLQINKK